MQRVVRDKGGVWAPGVSPIWKRGRLGLSLLSLSLAETFLWLPNKTTRVYRIHFVTNVDMVRRIRGLAGQGDVGSRNRTEAKRRLLSWTEISLISSTLCFGTLRGV
ncbi:hypothetical protein BDP81DRAFT_426656 [Colletotrichum phormii]|uniref:Uncharacterized protein n=1 Tax=Colletotrichum phormii TaxID=359342 RepID=A0AAJ0EFL5_9PEZI|nr:uncharacterized protein BDP81DRAFT_426656 [Colletotrichum phormii]KAK1637119.1 hypothetical protein BDP81DRAFT_426656 [Colletotrichum phormii]